MCLTTLIARRVDEVVGQVEVLDDAGERLRSKGRIQIARRRQIRPGQWLITRVSRGVPGVVTLST